MRALVLYGANDFSVRDDYPMPELKESWVIVEVAYSGICGSDMPRFFKTGSYKSPMVVGHEFSGIVSKTNEESKIKVGTPVAILPIIPCGVCENCKTNQGPFHCANYQFLGSRNDGGFSEFVAVPEENLFELDSADLLLSGAFIEPALVALHTIRRSNFAGDGNALVFGAGPIGLLVASWLKYFGADVTIVDIREYSLKIAKEIGLDKCYLFDEVPTKNYKYIYEASGSNPAFNKALELIDNRGVFTIVGRDSKDTVIKQHLLERAMRREVTINGCWGYNIESDSDILSDGFSKIPFDRMISHIVSLDESVEMLEKMNDKSEDYCKVIIDMKKDQK